MTYQSDTPEEDKKISYEDVLTKELLEQELDALFPKGDACRGRALVIYSKAMLIIKDREEEIEKLNRIKHRLSEELLAHKMKYGG
jgi:hypothetical protein